MNRHKVLVLAGTRPEVIKLAPVVRELLVHPCLESRLCTTGQHQQMLQQALNDCELTPDIALEVMTPDQTLASLTAALMPKLDSLLRQELPDILLVQGDTTTVMTATLAAFYQNIPVAHVEAGLRSFNMRAPFPEEANRRITGILAQLHFAPTEQARQNLLAEGTPSDRVHVTGNTVIDSLLWMADKNRSRDDLLPATVGEALAHNKKIILVTAHRRETYEQGFEGICQGILAICKREDVHVVYPVHLNPRVQEPVFRLLQGHPQITLLAPQAYRNFVALMQCASLILTDSGGVQEEAPSLGKPILVMRDVTERPEGVEAGNARLVGTTAQNIEQQVCTLLDDAALYRTMSTASNPYGDGHSAQRICRVLETFLDTSSAAEKDSHVR